MHKDVFAVYQSLTVWAFDPNQRQKHHFCKGKDLKFFPFMDLLKILKKARAQPHTMLLWSPKDTRRLNAAPKRQKVMKY